MLGIDGASDGATTGTSVGTSVEAGAASVFAGVGGKLVVTVAGLAAGAAHAESRLIVRGKTKKIRFIVSPVPNFARKRTLRQEESSAGWNRQAREGRKENQTFAVFARFAVN